MTELIQPIESDMKDKIFVDYAVTFLIKGKNLGVYVDIKLWVELRKQPL